jgi:hypothetical protein
MMTRLASLTWAGVGAGVAEAEGELAAVELVVAVIWDFILPCLPAPATVSWTIITRAKPKSVSRRQRMARAP